MIKPALVQIVKIGYSRVNRLPYFQFTANNTEGFGYTTLSTPVGKALKEWLKLPSEITMPEVEPYFKDKLIPCLIQTRTSMFTDRVYEGFVIKELLK